MNPKDEKVVSELIDLIETLYLRTVVQEAALDILSQDENWRSDTTRAEILHGPRIHALFDKLRGVLLELPAETPAPTDWQSIVRRIIDGEAEQ
jgi:hypothetical protein